MTRPSLTVSGGFAALISLIALAALIPLAAVAARAGDDAPQTAQTDRWFVHYELDGVAAALPANGGPGGEPTEAAPPADPKRLSPDGARRLVVDVSDGDAEIVSVPAVGEGPRRKLTENEAIDNFPAYHPTDDRVIFASTRVDRRWQVFTMDSDGGDVRRISDAPGGAWHPRWSPTGDLVSWLRRPPMRKGKLPPSDLVVAQPDGTGARTVLAGAQILEHAWAPDGKRIAVSTTGALVIVDAATGKEVRRIDHAADVDAGLHAHAAFGLRWRPDGAAIATRISFLGGRMVDAGGRAPAIPGDRELFILDLVGEAHRGVDLGLRVRVVGWSR